MIYKENEGVRNNIEVWRTKYRNNYVKVLLEWCISSKALDVLQNPSSLTNLRFECAI